MDKNKMKRVNVIIPESYHQEIMDKGMKLSGVVREALEDVLNPHTITLSVTPDTHKLYMELFNELAGSDKDFEPFLRTALKEYVETLIQKRTSRLEQIKDKL